MLRGFRIKNSGSTSCSVNPIYGGGLYLSDSSPTIVGCEFYESLACKGGGAYSTGNGDPTFVSCTFRNNATGQDGSGVYNSDRNASFHNCLFYENSAGRWGGALYNALGDPTFFNCTIADNSAHSDGGAIYNYDANSLILVKNSILYYSTSRHGEDEIAGNAEVWYSDYQGGWTGPGGNNIDVDPMFADRRNDIYVLTPDSPCENAGSNALLPPDVADLDWDCDFGETVPLDNNFLTRIWFGAVDMGAFEVQVARRPGGP